MATGNTSRELRVTGVNGGTSTRFGLRSIPLGQIHFLAATAPTNATTTNVAPTAILRQDRSMLSVLFSSMCPSLFERRPGRQQGGPLPGRTASNRPEVGGARRIRPEAIPDRSNAAGSTVAPGIYRTGQRNGPNATMSIGASG